MGMVMMNGILLGGMNVVVPSLKIHLFAWRGWGILQDARGMWLPSQYLYQTFPTCKGTVILLSQVYAPENTVLDYFMVEL